MISIFTSALANELRTSRSTLFNFFSRRNRLDKRSDVLISLTTYGQRLKKVHLTLETLMHQSRMPGQIILWLAAKDAIEHGISPALKRLQARGLEIHVVNEDLGPYKKLIHALEKYPDKPIITVDDDVYYPAHFVESMIDTAADYPAHVVAFRCAWMKKRGEQLRPYLQWPNATSRGPSYNLFPTGVSGVLYPPNSLDAEVLNKDVFMTIAPTADDIWFKCMTLLTKTQTVMVREACADFPTVPGTQSNALWRINASTTHSLNDQQLHAVFNRYKVLGLIT